MRSRYEAITGETTTLDMMADMINEAMDEIAKRYGPSARVQYIAVKGVEYALPLDHLETREIRDTDNDPRFDYLITEDGKIIFEADTTYQMIYGRVPAAINHEDNESVPDVHYIFHQMILKYCIARYWEDRDEGIPSEAAKAQRLMNEFFRRVEEAARKLRNRAYQPLMIGTMEVYGRDS